MQDAASLTVTAPAPQTISPLQTTSDVYTLTNTGNGPGTFALQTGTTTTLPTATNVTYTISGVTGLSAGCSTALTTIAQVNNCFLHNDPTTTTGAAVTVAAGATAQIAIGFTVNAGTAPGTQTTTLVANVTQGATASANATGTVTDTIASDAAMSLTKAAAVGGTAAAPTVAYVVAARNTGARPAAYLTASTDAHEPGAAGDAGATRQRQTADDRQRDRADIQHDTGRDVRRRRCRELRRCGRLHDRRGRSDGLDRRATDGGSDLRRLRRHLERYDDRQRRASRRRRSGADHALVHAQWLEDGRRRQSGCGHQLREHVRRNAGRLHRRPDGSGRHEE